MISISITINDWMQHKGMDILLITVLMVVLLV